MGVAQAVEIKKPVQRFRFGLSDTLGDIAMVARQIEKEGRAPFLRFVGLSTEDITGVEVLAVEPSIELTLVGREAIAEMAVAGVDAPDPAVTKRSMEEDVRWASVVDDTPVYWEGEWTTWSSLTGNEKMECTFNDDGIIVGGYRI